MAIFELNGRRFRTDAETVEVLRSIIPSAMESGDSSAVIAIVELGLKTGRIVEIEE